MVPDPYGSYNMTGDQWTPPKTWGGGQGGLGVGWVGCAYFWILVQPFKNVTHQHKQQQQYPYFALTVLPTVGNFRNETSSQRLHVWYIYLHLFIHLSQIVGKYTSPMDP